MKIDLEKSNRTLEECLTYLKYLANRMHRMDSRSQCEGDFRREVQDCEEDIVNFLTIKNEDVAK
jgi:hypothetical protein